MKRKKGKPRLGRVLLGRPTPICPARPKTAPSARLRDALPSLTGGPLATVCLLVVELVSAEAVKVACRNRSLLQQTKRCAWTASSLGNLSIAAAYVRTATSRRYTLIAIGARHWSSGVHVGGARGGGPR